MYPVDKTTQHKDKKGHDMSTRTKIQTAKVSVDQDGETKSFLLEYYVISGEARTDGARGKTYGIEVLKQSKTECGTLRVEYRKIFDIFCTEQEAISAACLLARNTVTPIGVHDVIEQLIGTDMIENEAYEIAAIS